MQLVALALWHWHVTQVSIAPASKHRAKGRERSRSDWANNTQTCLPTAQPELGKGVKWSRKAGGEEKRKKKRKTQSVWVLSNAFLSLGKTFQSHLFVSILRDRLAPTSCPSDNRLQGNSNANLEPDFSMGLYFCSSSRIRALENQPLELGGCSSPDQYWGTLSLPSPFLILIWLPPWLSFTCLHSGDSKGREK